MSSAPAISHRLYCTEGENHENERNEHGKTGVRPLAAHSPALGMKVIKNRHQACPVCGGADRFRFDDKEGRGTWFCNQCGAGDGLKLVEKVFGVSASEAAGKVNAVTGNLPPVAPEVMAAAEAGTEADRKAAATLAVRLLEKTRPATGNAYLTRKGFAGRECLTLTTSHKTGGVAYRAGDVVVPLYDGTGALVNLQLINAEGLKRTLKGGQVKGACHLIDGQKQAGKRLWIAEGYATALTVHHLTGGNRHGGAVVREPSFSGEPGPSETPGLSDYPRR